VGQAQLLEEFLSPSFPKHLLQDDEEDVQVSHLVFVQGIQL
jgi:hypothetical protein